MATLRVYFAGVVLLVAGLVAVFFAAAAASARSAVASVAMTASRWMGFMRVLLRLGRVGSCGSPPGPHSRARARRSTVMQRTARECRERVSGGGGAARGGVRTP